MSALLVHGLTGTPYEMRYLGRQLAARGIRTLGVKLAGHAGTPNELGASNHGNWYQSVVRGFERLRGFHDPIVVVGLSMGAVLSARLAADQGGEIVGLVMLAPAFFLTTGAWTLARVLRHFGRWPYSVYLQNTGGSDIHDAAAKRIHPTMALMPLSAPLNLYDLSSIVRPMLAKIRQPTLAIHSKQDHTIPFSTLAWLMNRLGCDDKRAVELEDSYHVITVDYDKERIAAEVIRFIEQVLPNRLAECALRGGHR
ncbi:MAG TPA: alpha/beta fold hydrolase [Candidatus Binataceae bacterium]